MIPQEMMNNTEPGVLASAGPGETRGTGILGNIGNSWLWKIGFYGEKIQIWISIDRILIAYSELRLDFLNGNSDLDI